MESERSRVHYTWRSSSASSKRAIPNYDTGAVKIAAGPCARLSRTCCRNGCLSLVFSVFYFLVRCDKGGVLGVLNFSFFSLFFSLFFLCFFLRTRCVPDVHPGRRAERDPSPGRGINVRARGAMARGLVCGIPLQREAGRFEKL